MSKKADDLDSVTIRTLKVKDLPVIKEMMVDMFKKNSAYPSHSDFQMGVTPGQDLTESNLDYLNEHCENHVKKRNYSGIVAEVDGKVLGFVFMKKHTPKNAPAWGELSDIVLGQSKRSDGLGQMLISRAMTVFRKWNITDVYLETGVHNKKAHRFFIGQGWKVVSHVLKISTALPPLPTDEVVDVISVGDEKADQK